MTFSFFSSAAYSAILTPPATFGREAPGGSAGRSTTSIMCRVPDEVTAPIFPWVVATTSETSASWLARLPDRESTAASEVRAIRPDVESSTRVGASAILRLSGAFFPFAVSSFIDPSMRTVRRGVPMISAVASSSVATSSRSFDSSASRPSRYSMRFFSSSRSASSSRRENFVSRRSWRSRM